MFVKFILFLVSSFVFSTSLAATCASNAAFTRAGWKVHAATEFANLENTLSATLQKDSQDFVLDMKSRMMSKASERPVEVTSWDRLSTPQEFMFGDVLTILDLRSGKYSELRWFDGTTKHVVYNSEFQKCAMDMVPLAINALF